MFLILLALAVVGLLIWLPIHTLVLAARLRRLGERLARIEAGGSPAIVQPDAGSEPVPLATPATPAETPSHWQPPPRPAAAPLGPTPAPADQNRPLVVSAERFGAALGWLARNWVYVVSAVSLALAAIFLLQYGVEHGLLPPAARVAAAMVLGLALVAAGEWLRRQHGDGARQVTAYLPSTFAGAGIVALFASVIAARQLYGLIGPELAFAGLVAIAALALVLGWLYGPWLAAVGLVGATAAPFLVGGASDVIWWLFPYFALIAATGLGIDAARRWAWVSVLALALGYAGGAMALAGGGAPGWFAAMLGGLALLAVAVPPLRLWPDHAGAMVSDRLWRKSAEWPAFPVRLTAGMLLATCLTLMLLGTDTAAESLLIFSLLAALVLAFALWAKSAPALADLTALPALGFLARLAVEAFGGPLHGEFMAQMIVWREPETSAPVTVTMLLALALAGSLAAAWRSLRATDAPLALIWAAGAVLFAPLAALALELFWAPALVIGANPWALHIMALAALMVWLAVLYARADAQSLRRAALATLSALSLIAFALFILLTETALTVALAALVVVAAALDRRFRLPEMGWYIQAALLVLSWRLLLDPGIDWALTAPLWEVALGFLATCGAMAAAWVLLGGLGRDRVTPLLESAGAGFAAILVDIVIFRWLRDNFAGDAAATHWGVTLLALPWLVTALVALWRLKAGGPLLPFRKALAALTGAMGLAGLLIAALVANPLVSAGFAGDNAVAGPTPFDTLTLAYLVPAALAFAAARAFRNRLPWLRLPLLWGSGVLAALWLGLEIRRFWVGDALWVDRLPQGELISYTVAMVLAAALLLYQSIARGSAGLRRLAMAVVVLTVLKVFLIDAAGLTGLTRVAAFLGLGLALAGTAWLNRWAAAQQRGAAAPDPEA
ncbi:DUF2339 domain-containing protein [Phaeovulum sp.]|uniref:DUF2339 domain-containing protein n=1 Tax=Phaeovulum sp. TaxID=2934796 RepID=UPI002730B1D5|nr:DUF2339 domain-containing protein [Phaeovulum sp.]MDP1668871.1 DUF2339 domain-containing protein [Phaeovulum sp.]MDZ4118208.1 DUF2339 domain-containing protein [Phaeovulum sp.]